MWAWRLTVFHYKIVTLNEKVPEVECLVEKNLFKKCKPRKFLKDKSKAKKIIAKITWRVKKKTKIKEHSVYGHFNFKNTKLHRISQDLLINFLKNRLKVKKKQKVILKNYQQSSIIKKTFKLIERLFLGVSLGASLFDNRNSHQ